MIFCSGSGIDANPSAREAAVLAAASMEGASASPNEIAASFAALRAISIFEAVVSYRLLASAVNALFASHDSRPVSMLLLSMSFAPVSRSITCAFSVPLMPRSESVLAASPPLFDTRARPSTKEVSAVTGSLFHAAENSDALMPDTRAKSSSFLPLDNTCVFIMSMTREITPPPSCASMPTDDIALASASTSDSLAPTCLAAPAMRCAMLTMSRSVEAPSLPSATSAEPKRCTPAVPSRSIVPITLEICAMAVAASSAERFVDSPRPIMVSVNPTRSLRFTPSWPAASATPAISSCVAGRVRVSPRN